MKFLESKQIFYEKRKVHKQEGAPVRITNKEKSTPSFYTSKPEMVYVFVLLSLRILKQRQKGYL